jgi:hypothetical protein
MNVLVYLRKKMNYGKQLLCKIPVFRPGRSASDNSFIAYKNSIIIENNYGYDIFPTMIFGRTSEPGIVRIDIHPDGRCEQIWESRLISQTTVPKLSLGSGLIYCYTKDNHHFKGIDSYRFSAIDFRTGKTIFQHLCGTGVLYDNNWAPITIGPEGTAYIGTVNGLIAIKDSHEKSSLIKEIKMKTTNGYIIPGLISLIVLLLIYRQFTRLLIKS